MYNILEDPYEKNDIKSEYPKMFSRLKSRAFYHLKRTVPADFPQEVLSGHPSLYGGFYSPGWCKVKGSNKTKIDPTSKTPKKCNAEADQKVEDEVNQGFDFLILAKKVFQSTTKLVTDRFLSHGVEKGQHNSETEKKQSILECF